MDCKYDDDDVHLGAHVGVRRQLLGAGALTAPSWSRASHASAALCTLPGRLVCFQPVFLFPYLKLGVLRLWIQTTTSGFCGFQRSDLGCQACVASTFIPWALSPFLDFYFFIFKYLHVCMWVSSSVMLSVFFDTGSLFGSELTSWLASTEFKDPPVFASPAFGTPPCVTVYMGKLLDIMWEPRVLLASWAVSSERGTSPWTCISAHWVKFWDHASVEEAGWAGKQTRCRHLSLS